MENNLKQGWVETELSEIVDINYGKDFRKKDFADKSGYPVYSANGILGYSTLYNRENETVVLGCRGSVGSVHLTQPMSYITHNCFSIEPFAFIERKYIFYLLKGVNICDAITGTAQPQITITNLSPLKIPLPPLAEQHRIVAKLDAVMQKVESNKQRLDKIPKLLKRFRQSVLAAAVSGKLTDDWRERNNLKEWEFKRAEDTCHLITKGTTPTNNGLTTIGEIPYLKVYNIVDQKVDFDYKPQYVSKEIHNNFLKRSRVYPGDVLMNIVGPPLGKVAVVPDTFDEWNINQAIAFFRAKEMILPEFIYIILCEGSPITEIEKEYRGTAGQSNISLEQCRNFLFPVPEIEEQKEIVRRVEQLFAFADKIEARYTKAKIMLDKLPQSILAKAFRGELVAQDSNDEPASVLLERIKAEKEKLAAEKKGKKTKEYSIEETPVKIAAEKGVKYKKGKK